MDRLDETVSSLDVLCNDIVERYHAALHRALPRIREDLSLVAAQAASGSVTMMRLAFGELADQIEAHLSKEEHLLFPALIALAAADRGSGVRPPSPFATVLHPIRMMEMEHARIEGGIGLLRDLASEVAEPVTLMPAWRRCMAALLELDEALRAHHRLENEVLFPRALDLERHLL